MKRPSFLSILTSDAIADNRPLWELIEQKIDQELLDAIAAEYCPRPATRYLTPETQYPKTPLRQHSGIIVCDQA